MHDEVRLRVHRYEARLDVPVARELLECDLCICTKDDIRMEVVLAGGFPSFLPSFLHGEPAEHDRFGGPCGGGTNCVGVFGCLPEICDYNV